MLLAVDVGTTQLKAGLFDRAGRLTARAEAPLALIRHPDPLWHESDARAWIAGLSHVAAALGVAGAGPIEAVVVSGNGPTLVPVSADGVPLAPALTWMDRRGVEEARIVSERCGAPIDPTFYLPKALWFFRNRPRLYEQARWFFSCPEYVAYVLTGVPATFLPTPQFTRYIWEEPLISALGMDPGRFPPFVPSGRILGAVSAAGASATGIPAGVPVVSGGPDFIVSLLGTATVAPGRACIRAGTSEGINLCSRRPVSDRRLLCLSHIAEGCWNVSGIISTSGKALEWFRTAAGRSDGSWESLFAEIEAVSAGADRLLFLPYLAGERAPLWDPLARGAFIGLTLNHGRAEMLRAVAESVGFAIRDVVEVMEEIGLSVQDLRITGRPARSRVWNQIRADITGRRILVPEAEDSDLAGDVCLALAALGEYGSAAEASEAIVRIGSVCEPVAERTRLYDELFALYRESYRGLKAVFEKLSTPRSAP
ncbi:MAG: FGGY family carbohydrate kinase [Spirochaetes bacterium]|nr:FGGY family carbohydrate kinase [Spirochaetota bacterium]